MDPNLFRIYSIKYSRNWKEYKKDTGIGIRPLDKVTVIG